MANVRVVCSVHAYLLNWPSLFASIWMSSSRNFRRTWSSLRSLNGTQNVGLRQFSSRLRWSRPSLSIMTTNVHPPPATQWNSVVKHRLRGLIIRTLKCTQFMLHFFSEFTWVKELYREIVEYELYWVMFGNSHTVIVHVAVNLNFSASQQYRVGATIGVWIFILDFCTRVRLKKKFEQWKKKELKLEGDG